MFSSNAYEKSKSATRSTAGGNLSTRYDRICPLVRRGGRCKQHETFKSWCLNKERNTPNQHLLQQSAAMVYMTYREDTIQKQDCPFLHPKPGDKNNKNAAKAAAVNKNAVMIEGLVDYFYAEQEKQQEEEQQQQQQQEENNQQQDNNNNSNITSGISIKLERDPTSAIMANQLVEKLYETLTPETKQVWRSQELTFNNADFCTCFCSAVAVMMQINNSNPNASKIRSIFLQENKINSDAMENIVRAMKICKVQLNNNNSNTNDKESTTKDNNHNNNTASLASQVILLDLSNNKIDNLTRCLFEFKAYFPNLLSLFIRENPITKRPDYSELVRRTVPHIVMLDGKNLRRPPLKMPYPKIWNIEIDTSSPANESISAMQRGARNFIAAYLKSLENDTADVGVSREELYKEDEDLRDQVMHPGIVASLSFVPTNTSLFGVPSDVLTEEEFLARAKALEKKGGRVGALTREKAQNLVLEKKLAEKNLTTTTTTKTNGNNNIRQREDKNSTEETTTKEQEEDLKKVSGMRFITKLDAKTLRSLPVSAARNCRNISDGKNAIERIAKGRMEVMDLLFGSLYLEGLSISHHTTGASIATVTPICMPSLWKQVKEEERQRKIQQRLKELNVVSKKEMKKKNKNNNKRGGDDNDDDDAENDAFATAKNKNKSPSIFLVTVHGTMSWRSPSLVGQNAICVAADHTFCVVATETEDFFKEREVEDEARFNEYLRKMASKEDDEDEENKDEEDTKSKKNEDDADAHEEDEDDELDDDFKTPQQLQKEEMLHYLEGFRICNHAVMLRELNSSQNSTTTTQQQQDQISSSSSNNNSMSTNTFLPAPFLFNPTRFGRLERLAHIYGTTPSTVAKVMERCESDAACEEMLASMV